MTLTGDFPMRAETPAPPHRDAPARLIIAKRLLWCGRIACRHGDGRRPPRRPGVGRPPPPHHNWQRFVWNRQRHCQAGQRDCQAAPSCGGRSRAQRSSRFYRSPAARDRSNLPRNCSPTNFRRFLRLVRPVRLLVTRKQLALGAASESCAQACAQVSLPRSGDRKKSATGKKGRAGKTVRRLSCESLSVPQRQVASENRDQNDPRRLNDPCPLLRSDRPPLGNFVQRMQGAVNHEQRHLADPEP
jgi:hypothetical protein